jgi:hypothetical protein
MKYSTFKTMAAVLPICMVMACGGSSDPKSTPYSMTVLPSKYSINIPSSLSSGTVSSDSAVSAKLAAKKSSDSATGTESAGCTSLRSDIAMMKSFTTMPALYTIIADAAISQNGIKPGDAEKTCSVTLTQGMVDKMLTILSDDMVSASELSSAVGSKIDVTIAYKTETGTYAYSVTITDLTDGGAPDTIYWSADKTKTKLSTSLSSESASGESTTASIGTLEFTYDDTAKLMNMSFDFSGSKMEMSLKEEGTGALFYSTMVAGTTTFKCEGYADDNGGYIKTSFTDGIRVSAVTTEYFDAKGLVTAENSTYTQAYTSNSDEFTTLQQTAGFSMDVTGIDIDNGEYLVYAVSWNGISVFDKSSVVGYGKVSNGILTIDNIGGGAYDDITTTGGTVYLYKVTTGSIYSATASETAPTFSSEAVPVTITLL